jgi:hypothetical protein
VTASGGLRQHLPAIAVTVTWAVISVMFILFAIHVWPTGGQDSQCMLPPAVEYRSSGELLHPFWQKAKVVDPAGKGRLVFHGFLLQVMAGTFAPATGYPAVHLVVMVIPAVALGFFALALLRVMKRFGEVKGWYKSALGVLAVAGLATVLVGLHSRPEPLTMLFVAAAFCAMTWIDVRRHWIAAGTALGLMAVTSPLPAGLGFIIFAIYIHIRLAQRAALVSLVGAGCLAAALAALITQFWYPYSIADWIGGLRNHWATTFSVPKESINYWFTHPRNSFYGFLYLLALGLGLHAFHRRNWRVRSRVGLLCSVGALAALVVRYCLYVPGLNYNLLVFAPLVYLAVVFTSLEMNQAGPTGTGLKKLRPALNLLILAILMLTTLGFARTLIMFPRFLKDGITYVQAKARLEEIRRSASGSVLIAPAFYVLTDDYQGLSVMEMPHHTVPKTHEIVVFAQVGLGRHTPPQIDGYRLVEDRFDRNVPRLLGVTLGNSCRGYDYAVYKRE